MLLPTLNLDPSLQTVHLFCFSSERMRLVEETQAHVVVGLLFDLLLLLLLSRGFTATSSSGGSSGTTARGNGGELLSTLSNQLLWEKLWLAYFQLGKKNSRVFMNEPR